MIEENFIKGVEMRILSLLAFLGILLAVGGNFWLYFNVSKIFGYSFILISLFVLPDILSYYLKKKGSKWQDNVNNLLYKTFYYDLLTSIYFSSYALVALNWYTNFETILFYLFSTMAQVQASFIAIVISVSYITSQFVASIYGNHTLKILSWDKIYGLILGSFILSIIFDIYCMGILPNTPIVGFNEIFTIFGTEITITGLFVGISLVLTTFNLLCLSSYLFYCSTKTEPTSIADHYLNKFKFKDIEKEVSGIDEDKYWYSMYNLDKILKKLIDNKDTSNINFFLRTLKKMYSDYESRFYAEYEKNNELLNNYLIFLFDYLRMFYELIEHAIESDNEQYIQKMTENVRVALINLQNRKINWKDQKICELFLNRYFRIASILNKFNILITKNHVKLELVDILILFYEILVEMIVQNKNNVNNMHPIVHRTSECILLILNIMKFNDSQYFYLLNPKISRLNYITHKIMLNSTNQSINELKLITKSYSINLLNLISSNHIKTDKTLKCGYGWKDTYESVKYYLMQAVFGFATISETKKYLSDLANMGGTDSINGAIKNIRLKKGFEYAVDVFENYELFENKNKEQIVKTGFIELSEKDFEKFEEIVENLRDVLEE